LIGAVLMGVGGVTALGCTIGQGLSGLSTLSLGSFVALAGILAGGVLLAAVAMATATASLPELTRAAAHDHALAVIATARVTTDRHRHRDHKSRGRDRPCCDARSHVMSELVEEVRRMSKT